MFFISEVRWRYRPKLQVKSNKPIWKLLKIEDQFFLKKRPKYRNQISAFVYSFCLNYPFASVNFASFLPVANSSTWFCTALASMGGKWW